MYACRSFRLLISMFIIYMNVSLWARVERGHWSVDNRPVRERRSLGRKIWPESVCMRPKSLNVNLCLHINICRVPAYIGTHEVHVSCWKHYSLRSFFHCVSAVMVFY